MMSEPSHDPESAGTVRNEASAFALRGRPRPVIRFRKGLIVGIVAGVALTIWLLVWISLKPVRVHAPTSEEAAKIGGRQTVPDALAGAPATYGDIPRLGPPLPGDLGRPIVERQRELSGIHSYDQQSGSFDAGHQRTLDQQRLQQQVESARSSPVMIQLEREAPTSNPASAQAPAAQQQPSEPAGSVQEHKVRFAEPTGNGGSAELAPLSRWTLDAGTIISASLITGLNSDLPGTVIAQVSENVCDSPTGRTVLIPRGAKLIGRYDASVSFGEKRILLVWEKIVFPDGATAELDKMPATDSGGRAGLEDGVNFHEWRLVKGIALATLLGLGNGLSFGGDSDVARAIRETGQQNGTRAGEQIVAKNLGVQPTLTVRPGWPVRAIVQQELVLKPWTA
jgi:type IV secretory pathway VirB10-like protein